MATKTLSKKEKDFLNKYTDYHLQLLRPPTREELAKYLKTSPQLVQYYISILKKKGYIKGRR